MTAPMNHHFESGPDQGAGGTPPIYRAEALREVHQEPARPAPEQGHSFWPWLLWLVVVLSLFVLAWFSLQVGGVGG